MLPHTPPPLLDYYTDPHWNSHTDIVTTLTVHSSHQKKNQPVYGNMKKPDTEYIALIKISQSLQDYQDYKTSLKLNYLV
jgi:hypothetical protein